MIRIDEIDANHGSTSPGYIDWTLSGTATLGPEGEESWFIWDAVLEAVGGNSQGSLTTCEFRDENRLRPTDDEFAQLIYELTPFVKGVCQELTGIINQSIADIAASGRGRTTP
jgi:hypothetical protein